MSEVFIGGLIAILTLVANRLFDYLQKKQENKQNIQRFFVEKKVNAGEQAISYWKEIKSIMETYAGFFSSIPSNPGSNFGKIFAGTITSLSNKLDALSNNSNVNNTIYLYYDLESVVFANENNKKFIDGLNKLGNKETDLKILKQMLNESNDDTMKDLIRQEIKKNEQEAIQQLLDLAKVFESGGQVYDELIRAVRKEIKSIEDSIC